jgi:hypothetical protein
MRMRSDVQQSDTDTAFQNVHAILEQTGGGGAEAAAAGTGSLPPGEGRPVELGHPPEPQLCRLRPCRCSGVLFPPSRQIHPGNLAQACSPDNDDQGSPIGAACLAPCWCTESACCRIDVVRAPLYRRKTKMQLCLAAAHISPAVWPMIRQCDHSHAARRGSAAT